MAEQNILQHWILPQQGLNKDTRYENAPPGNAPKLNALDSNCNQVIHCTVLEHVAMTANMNKEDTFKFSVNSPLTQDDAYLHLWDPSLQLTHPMGWKAGVPSSKQIIEDMMRIPEYSVL
eukprot:15358358-Ditylum_brightwellii.AAC.1